MIGFHKPVMGKWKVAVATYLDEVGQRATEKKKIIN